MSNLRSWFSDQFGGIKEGIEKRSFVAAVLQFRDKKAGQRGAFGKGLRNYRLRRVMRDRYPAHNAARGPRPNTWWKSADRYYRAPGRWNGNYVDHSSPPPVFTRP